MKIKVNMQKFLRHAGIGLVYGGSILLILNYVIGVAQSNTLLIISALMVIVGTILHVYRLKRDSEY